jgi:hypothetical protein
VPDVLKPLPDSLAKLCESPITTSGVFAIAATSPLRAQDSAAWAALRLALHNQARPTQKALRDAGRFIEPELVQVQDLKRQAEFVTNLFFRNHRRPGIVWLARVAGQDQAAATRSQPSRHGRGVLLRCVSTNGMVTTAIEKECKSILEIRQLEHIGNHETRLHPGGVSAPFRLLYRQGSQVDTGYLKALLRQPNTIASRSTA